MKKYLFLFFSICIFKSLFSQQFEIKTIDDGFGVARGIEIADLDNDGNLDIVSLRRTPTPQIACWFGDGLGNFGAKVIIQETVDGPSTGFGDDLTVMDVNNDGWLDVVATPEYRLDESDLFSKVDPLAWYPNNGDRSFDTAVEIERFVGARSNRILTMDVNNDGFEDIVLGDKPSNPFEGQLSYWNNNRNNGFELRIPVTDVDGVDILHLEKGHFNNDDFLDLVFVGSFYSINIVMNNQDGTFQLPRKIFEEDGFSPTFVTVGDVNGDNIADLLISSSSISEEVLAWAEGDGNGNFLDRKIIAVNEGGLSSGSELALADLDGDGDQDAVLVGAFSQTEGSFLQWWTNDGEGNFGARVVINGSFDYGYGMEVADLNNDGTLDIVATNDSGVYWFENVKLDQDNDGVLDANDICPNTPEGSSVDVSGCIVFSLPVNNFTVSASSVTCQSSNNGIVSLEAKENYNYTAVLNGETSSGKAFTDEVEFDSLSAGNYEICISIEGQSDYRQCFSLSITEPEDLSVSSKVDSASQKVNLSLYGSSNYIINFNGEEFSTTKSEISLNLIKGENVLKVKTEKQCQGLFEKTFLFTGKTLAYPNPVKGKLFIEFSGNKEVITEVIIYNINGTVVLKDSFMVIDEQIELDMSSVSNGVYFLKVLNGQNKAFYKVVK